jgi:putative transposase
MSPEPDMSIREQCRLLQISRSSYYYKPREESPENLEYMKRIDELYMDNPTWGSRKMRDRLRLDFPGRRIHRKRVQRLMNLMGIEAIYPKKNLSKRHPDHKIYPYLLRNLDRNRPNMVWCTDITYIRLQHGFVYLVAVLDWYSRKVLSWELSNTLDSHFCVSALKDALEQYGTPEIFNTAQGVQFTSQSFIGELEKKKIRISMDGKGRCLDTVVVERFWRSLKYDEVYLKDYSNMTECYHGIKQYIEKYNSFRPHSSHNGITPDMAYEAA